NAGTESVHSGVTGARASATASTCSAARASSSGLAAVRTSWLVTRRSASARRSCSGPGGWVASGPCPSTTGSGGVTPRRLFVDDGDGLLRALAHGLLHLGAEVVGRRLLEDVEEVVVPHLEHLGRDAH